MNKWTRNVWCTLSGVFLTAILTVLIVASLRIFLFASFTIPTSSMRPAVLPGDHVLVNKLVPGPRMDWLAEASDMGGSHSYRMTGRRSVTRGDVLVFNAPYHNAKKIKKNLSVYYLKRCMGIPGDTLYIKGRIYEVKNSEVSFKVSRSTNEYVDGAWMDTHKPRMFKELGWTLTSFGPAYIPRKGERIRLDSVNIHLYKTLIEYETGREVSFSDNLCFLDSVPYPYHEFQQNYYFMAGDYAIDSEDSRFWGLLPEDHIVGKAAYIWRSKDPDTRRYRFDRFLKPIN